MLGQIRSRVLSELESAVPSGNVRLAAVLCLVMGETNALSILLTKRSLHLNEHAGQMSFPGGKLERSDENIVDAALREAEEEIGLSSGEVEILGFLSPVLTSTQFHISPVVGYLAKTPLLAMQQLKVNLLEVEEIVISPLSLYLEPNCYHLKEYETKNGKKNFWAIRNTNPLVWGATAAILKQLSEILSIRT